MGAAGVRQLSRGAQRVRYRSSTRPCRVRRLYQGGVAASRKSYVASAVPAWDAATDLIASSKARSNCDPRTRMFAPISRSLRAFPGVICPSTEMGVGTACRRATSLASTSWGCPRERYLGRRRVPARGYRWGACAPVSLCNRPTEVSCDPPRATAAGSSGGIRSRHFSSRLLHRGSNGQPDCKDERSGG